MIAVQRFMPAAVAEILRKAPLTPEKVAFAWRSAVGAAVDKATSVELRGGILQVQTKDAAWQREIERSAVVIRGRLDALLGPDVVRYIDVTTEPVRRPAPQESPRSAGGSDNDRRRR
jgi:hypothetical protein